MDIGNFLRALMRDVAWGFFYGGVNFDAVFGTVNHYKSVDMYAGAYNGTMKEAGVDVLENFPTDQIRATFEAMLDDWTNAGFDPFAAPLEKIHTVVTDKGTPRDQIAMLQKHRIEVIVAR